MQRIRDRLSSSKVLFPAISHDFMHVVYPFLRIFKYFGFVPLKLEQNGTGQHMQWDLMAVACSICAFTVWLVGYVYGLKKLSRLQNWEELRVSSPIAYAAIWLNIGTTFLVGFMAPITSWFKLGDFQRIFALVFEIDRKLRRHFGIKFNYSLMLVKVCLVFGAIFAVPAVFSMVNCVIVMPKSRVFNLAGSCYWFICVAPIFLSTMKEFQFVNLLWLLKLKFNKINEKLQEFANTRQPRRISFLTADAVTSETLLNSKNSSPKAENVMPNVENMKVLLDIYSMTADGIELVMGSFAWHLLLTTTGAICIITLQSYYLFAQLIEALTMQFHHMIFIIVWLLLQILVVSVNIKACEAAAKTMSDTGKLLHKLSVNVEDEACENLFYQIVNVFSLEVMQRQNSFTAAGYFDINYKLITAMFSTITTYLIILIQFHLGSPKTQPNSMQ